MTGLDALQKAEIGQTPHLDRVDQNRGDVILASADQVFVGELQEASDIRVMSLLFDQRNLVVFQIDDFDGAIPGANCDLVVWESKHFVDSFQSGWTWFDESAVLRAPYFQSG